MTPIARDLLQSFPGLRTSADDADRVAYARDLWPRHLMAVRSGHPAEHRPGAIVWPSSTEQVASLVRWASRRGVALVPFGGGSGVCAGVLPQADVVIMDLKRLARVRSLDRRAPLIEVEAGHMGVPLEQSLLRAGFTLGHFPSSILCSTVGGWVATRSAGQCSGAYGKIEDMVVALECVTGRGDVVALRRRTTAPDLVPLVAGSEGTLAVVTSATLRLHPAPTARGFGAWSFPTTPHGWHATRALFQAGLRPAVARLYDPFDALIAKRGGRGRPKSGNEGAPGFAGAALRALLQRPSEINQLLQSEVFTRAVGGAMLIVVFESQELATAERDLDEARRLVATFRGTWLGDSPARAWLEHRYSVSFGQAPLFARGVFVDTMEIATKWSTIGAVYDAVRTALRPSALVMAHFSHPYPDGCCIYFSFAGSADPALAGRLGWDGACTATYDRAWKDALSAATEAGGTLAHHHGVGRSKARFLPAELGAGIDVVRALMRVFDPSGILNPGNLLPHGSTRIAATTANGTATATTAEAESTGAVQIDHESLLARIEGRTELGAAECVLNQHNLTLDVTAPAGTASLGQWLAAGAEGSRDPWLDPADQLVAGFEARLRDGRRIDWRPVPRRSVGPDLTALFVGAHGRFGEIERAWLRVHRRGIARPAAAPFEHERDPAPSAAEIALIDRLSDGLAS